MRGIFSTCGPFPHQSLSDVIVARGSAYGVTFDTSYRRFDLEFTDYAYVTHAIASDCKRLATACLQTAHEAWLTKDEKSSIPWTLVRLYYASFYAGHVLVRLLGHACCWLESSHLARVDEVTKVITGSPPPFRPEPGAYRCSVDTSGKLLQWTRVGIGAKGAHEALWATLDSTLRELDARILGGTLPTRVAQAVVAKLEEFRQLATENGSQSWLSRTRNDVQYRLEHGVWHPTSVAKRERDQIRRFASQWLTDPMNVEMVGARSHGLLCQFASACAFILSVFRVLLLRIEERSANRAASFVRYGPRAFASFAKLEIGRAA